MIGLLQRVTEASVLIEGDVVAEIQRGVLALIGVQRGDTPAQGRRLLERMLSYRLFPDDTGRMNERVASIAGGLLLVPQFTLAANTDKGSRASFARAEVPAKASLLFADLLVQAKTQHGDVAAGVFAADMQVRLINDGPVTFWLQVSPETL